MANNQKSGTVNRKINKTIIYVVCISLAVLSILPFWIMFVNATRSTPEIQGGLSLLPSSHMMSNLRVLLDKSFDPLQGFMNSFIIASSATLCTVYFSSLAAYGLVTYSWKLRGPFFTFIMCVMMIPSRQAPSDSISSCINYIGPIIFSR